MTPEWERIVRLTNTAPSVPLGIAEDLVYAFAHGWIELPAAALPGEPSERLTRLYAVKRHVESDGAY